jgi:hypothetical protein
VLADAHRICGQKLMAQNTILFCFIGLSLHLAHRITDLQNLWDAIHCIFHHFHFASFLSYETYIQKLQSKRVHKSGKNAAKTPLFDSVCAEKETARFGRTGPTFGADYE